MNRSEQKSPHQPDGKEPWLAVNLSWFLPGIGQIYAGKYQRGLAILFGYYLSIAISIWFLIDLFGNVLIGFALLIFVLAILPLGNLFDAYWTAKNVNSTEFEFTRKQHKDAWLSVFLSGFIPGLGHIYLKQWLPAILFITVSILTVSGVGTPTNLQPYLLILRFIVGLLAGYFAYVSTPIRRDVPRLWIGLIIAGFLGVSAIVGSTIALSLRAFVLEARFIPSGAMLPTLQINDRLIINKSIYRFQDPQRGDIAIFSPHEALKKEGYREAFVKRIIGIPGDRVEIKEGQVRVNDRLLVESYVDKDLAGGRDFPAQTVPPNFYLVLGDNRNNSYDSRYYGFIPRKNIIGRATQRFWPIDRLGSLAEK
jgi:signal peptidase I